MSAAEKFGCEVCGVSSQNKPTFRVNPKGELGIFRCEDCLDTSTDPIVKEIVNVIQRR